MGKRSYNWKARQVVETEIDNSSTKKIKLDLEATGTYDHSNALVLPSDKRRTKVKSGKEEKVRILSRKQRKRLEKIVEKKEKKKHRTDLLDQLSKVQATEEHLKQLVSLAAVQTKGIKKYFNAKSQSGDTTEGGVRINSIRGARRKLLNFEAADKTDYDRGDPNIVGLESSSSGSDEELSEDETQVEENNEGIAEINGENIEIDEEGKSNMVETFDKIANDAIESKNMKNVKDKREEIDRKPAVFVEVERDPEIQKARLKLPILAEEQQIMETIKEHPIIIIAGETGSGKTTQVPQFLYEAGYAANKAIAVTEPRRIAAVSMSRRVAEELNLTPDVVSYLIRFEGNATDGTKIKFMTDGVLLREVKRDFLLSKYSVVILDEAHERSVYTDILIGFLSRIVPLRSKRGDPLKLIIMSATLRLSDFTGNDRLFRKAPPVVSVEARQFPVTVHFNRRTNEDYLKEALRKTAKVHNKLPEGGILVFVTGQKEVNYLVKKLRSLFPVRNRGKVIEASEKLKEDTSDDENFDERLKKVLKRKKKKITIVPDVNLDDYDIPNGENNSDSENFSEMDDDNDLGLTENLTNNPLWVLPLYSLLPNEKQSRVFQRPPEGCRLCIVTTNVAETSLTIPNIKYVVDTGKTKTKLYDKTTGLTSYVVTWTSKASANQRAGRAGRTSPGHCYRLYSSAVFNDVFQDFLIPEIQQKPVDDLYLQMKCMHIDKIINFPFPTAPDLLQLKTAERTLEILGLLENSKVTDLGRTVSRFPIAPRYGKMLALSHQFNLLPYTILLVSALSVQELLIETHESSEMQKFAAIRKKWVKTGNHLLLGDLMVLLTAVGGAEYANSQGRLEKFCRDNGLREKAVVEIRKIRLQLTKEINLSHPDLNITVDPKLPPPSDLQAKLLRQIALSGTGDRVAKKIDTAGLTSQEKKRLKYAYQSEYLEDPVFVHRNSVLRSVLPEFVTFQEIYETNRMYMRNVMAIECEWLPVYAPKLCNLSEPLLNPEPTYDEYTGRVKCTVTGSYGKSAFVLPNVRMDFPNGPQIYKWFAKFFLQGLVFQKLEKFGKDLLNPAYTVVRPWAKLQPKVVKIVQRLAVEKVCSRSKLLDVWQKDSNYLLPEYLLWLPESLYGEATLLWPPI